MVINGHKLPDKVEILGTEYQIFYVDESSDPKIEDADGYCELHSHEIFIEKTLFENTPDKDKFVMKDLYKQGLKVLRHEIIHAFIKESGLWECCDWAENEELTDWIARQFPKMSKCFEQAGIAE